MDFKTLFQKQKIAGQLEEYLAEHDPMFLMAGYYDFAISMCDAWNHVLIRTRLIALGLTPKALTIPMLRAFNVLFNLVSRIDPRY